MTEDELLKEEDYIDDQICFGGAFMDPGLYMAHSRLGYLSAEWKFRKDEPPQDKIARVAVRAVLYPHEH